MTRGDKTLDVSVARPAPGGLFLTLHGGFGMRSLRAGTGAHSYVFRVSAYRGLHLKSDLGIEGRAPTARLLKGIFYLGGAGVFQFGFTRLDQHPLHITVPVPALQLQDVTMPLG